MADWSIGQTIIDGFNTGTPGETFTVIRADDPDGDDIADDVEFTESDNAAGYYDIAIPATKSGAYRMSWSGDTSGRTFEATYRVVTVAQFDPAAVFAGGRITVVSPVAIGGDAEIWSGDDAYLPWSTVAESDWPYDLEDADIVLFARAQPGNNVVPTSSHVFSVAGTVEVATGATKKVSVMIPRAYTYSIAGEYSITVKAQLAADDAVKTLVAAILTIKPTAGTIR